MNSDSLILRQTTNPPLTNKNDFLTSEDFDSNFVKIYDDLVGMLVTSGVLDWNVSNTYDDTIEQFAMYNGRLYRYIYSSPSTGVIPAAPGSEDYWIEIFPTDLAHRKNSDTILAEGTPDEVSAAEIKAFIAAGLTSTTDLSISERTITSFKLNSSTGADVVIDEATPDQAGLLSAKDKVKLSQLDGINTGDQTLEDLFGEDVRRKAEDFTTINHELYPSVEATDVRITEKIEDIKGAPPVSLNTLEKIAAAIDNDPTFEATIRAEIINSVATQTITVRNTTGGTLYKGTVVYISGVSGGVPLVSKSIATDGATSDTTIGTIFADIPNNTNGQLLTNGPLIDIDLRTTAPNPITIQTLSVGDKVFISKTVPGYITNIKPASPDHAVRVGYVLATGISGKLLVTTHIGAHIADLHDVLITTPSNDQALVYESASGLWKNKILSAPNLGSSNLTSSAAQRTFTLYGNTSVDTLEIKNQAGQNIATFQGDKNVRFDGNIGLGGVAVGHVGIFQNTPGLTYGIFSNSGSYIYGASNSGATNHYYSALAPIGPSFKAENPSGGTSNKIGFAVSDFGANSQGNYAYYAQILGAGAGINYGSFYDIRNAATNYAIYIVNGLLRANLPTSSAGLPSRVLWDDGGTVKITP